MTTQTEAQHYPNHDAEALGQDYINHISAMTTEGLRAKSSIAIQLAWRDVEIRRLEAANAELLDALLVAARSAEALKRECSMSDHESAQATRNTQYMSISYAARAAIKKHGGAA